MRRRRLLADLAAESRERAGDREHLVVRESLLERVLHPVAGYRRAPRHRAQALAVVEQLQLLAVDRARVRGRVAQDRRIGPGRALDAVVVAVLAIGDDEAIGGLHLAVGRLDAVWARILELASRVALRRHVLTARGEQLRVVDGELHRPQLDRVVLAGLRHVREPGDVDSAHPPLAPLLAGAARRPGRLAGAPAGGR